jgi:MFS family permease
MHMSDAVAKKPGVEVSEKGIVKIIAASSVGTMVEWYDFYIFGSLATVIASKFYQTGTPTGDIIAWLATFAVGFIVRPFGAIVFGRMGDLIGRKYTFMVTMTLMGVCTFAVGLLPTYDWWQAAIGFGEMAGIILITLRILQGLALGGEYGGAATYVAEHSPERKRGFWTSWIQITATAGLFMSLGVILGTNLILKAMYGPVEGALKFNAWGWRVPFLLSIVLIAVSLYIRISLKESPLFAGLKKSGGLSKNPLKESFGNPYNLKYVLLAMFGVTMGQGVVWYTGQFYALFYLQKIFHVALVPSNVIVGAALLLAVPFFVIFGKWSDTIGRKPIMFTGMALAIVLWYPLYGLMAANAPATFPVLPADMKGYAETTKSTTAAGKPVPTTTIVKDGQPVKISVDQVKLGDNVVVKYQKFIFPYSGYNPWILGFCVFIQVMFVTMVYGPIAAFLVELFPTKIRYTSMSLPYHIGNGVFGGLVPIIGLMLITRTGNNYAGLWWPMGVAIVCFIIGMIWVPETFQIDIHSGESAAYTAEHGIGSNLMQVEPDEI